VYNLKKIIIIRILYKVKSKIKIVIYLRAFLFNH